MVGKRLESATSSFSLPEHTLKAEEVASNVDLLTEVLLRSPAESVLRFKCIRKQWCSLISEPKFATNHVQMSPTPSISGLYLSTSLDFEDGCLKPVPYDTSRRLPSLDFVDCFEYRMKVADSSSGLLLCWFCRTTAYQRSFMVFNPATQKHRLLPDVPAYIFAANILYEPSTAVYKAVLTDKLLDKGWDFHIFSSDTSSWKLVRVSRQKINLGCCTRTVSWVGAVHWMYDGTELLHYKFDIDTERLDIVAVPPSPEILPFHKTKYFGASGDSLFLIQTREPTASMFRILEMGKGCSGWTVKYHFNLKDAFPISSELIGSKYSLLCVVNGAEENDAEIIVAASGKIVSYNFKCKKVKFLSRLPMNPVFGRLRAFQYQASLAPV